MFFTLPLLSEYVEFASRPNGLEGVRFGGFGLLHCYGCGTTGFVLLLVLLLVVAIAASSAVLRRV